MVVKPESEVAIHSADAKRDKQDCLVCILRPILILGAIVGVSPIAYSCPHNRRSRNTEFRRSWICYVFTLAIFILVVSMLIHNFHYLVATSNSNTKDKIVQIATLVLFELSTIIIYVTILLQIQERVKDLNGLVAIINNKHFYNIDEGFFEKKSIKYFKICVIKYSLITLCLFIIHATHLYCSFVNIPSMKIAYAILRGFSSCFSLVSQEIFIFQYIIELKIYRHMLKRSYQIMKEELDVALNGKKEVWADRTHSMSDVQSDAFGSVSENIAVKRLQKLQRLHCALIINLKQLNKYLNPMMLMTIGLTVLILVLSYYLIINIWMTNNFEHNGMYYLLEFKSISIIASVTYLLIISDSVQDPVSTSIY